MKQTGFIEPIITPDQYVQGDLRIGAVEPVLEEDGDWGEWDIIFDVQAKNFDTFNCTGFGISQSISKIIKRKYGIDFKPSPRWIGIIAGTDPSKGGNDPHTVCEAIRKFGLIPDEMLPWSDDITTVDEYFSFKGANKDKCFESGKKWLEEFDFKHDWVLSVSDTLETKLNKMKTGLTYSPLGGAVSAWMKNEKGLYVRFGKDNHWTEIRAFRTDNAIVDDSYEPFEKELSSDFNFQFVKRYIVNKKQPVTPERAKTILEVLMSFLKNGLAWLFPQWIEEYNTVPAREIPIKEIIQNKDYLTPMAEAIQLFEGWAEPNGKDRTGKVWPNGSLSWRNNNPGNIKNSDGNFIKYSTYEVGFSALVYYLTRACTGRHKAYKPTMSIREFFSVYSPDGNEIESNYASFVCKYMSEKMKEPIFPSKQLKELV